MNNSRYLGIIGVLLLMAAAMTVYTMFIAAGWNLDLAMSLFIVWAISPYLSFFAASRLILKLAPDKGMAIPAVVISVLMLAFTLFAYIGTLRSDSSTSALAFIFVPLYLYIGAFFLLSVSILIARLISRKGPV